MLRNDSIPDLWRSCNCLLKNNGVDDFLLWILLLQNECKVRLNPYIIYKHTYTEKNYSLDYDKMDLSSDEMVAVLRKYNILKKWQLSCYIRNQYYDRLKRKHILHIFNPIYIYI